MYAPRTHQRSGKTRELRPIFPGLVALFVVVFVVVAGGACWPDRAKIQPPVVPPVLNGACCDRVSGACAIQTSPGCLGLGAAYDYRGDETVCSPNPCSTQPPGDYIATGRCGSLEAKEINTASGAGLKVPLLAVPKTIGGAQGSMTFSIEKADGIAATLPTGHTKASDIYRFGPDGFVFGRPVQLKVPVTGDTAGKSFVLCRINETTLKSEIYGGVYDRATKSIAVQTYKLSPWFVATAPQANTSWGAIEVTNGSLDQWLNLCVEQYQLKYPEADVDFHGEASSSWAPVGEIGVTNHGLWFVPQGTYRLCAEMRRAGTISSPPGPAHHIVLDNIQVNEPWTYSQPRTTPVTLNALGEGAIDSTCACVPVATPSVGTGDVQVTLTWHSAQALDLDLWVTEPNGTRCYYAHDSTSTGGHLDIDNNCGSYIDGRPENIFWANAPAGEYKVEVDWYSGCGTGAASIGYDLRVINAGTVRTFSGTINADATLEVTRFTVAAGRRARFLPTGESSVSHGPRPPKPEAKPPESR
jgi:hypothetical protein